jgi:hypothetical protein
MFEYYYPKTTWNITVALLHMFNNMTINRFDNSGNIVKTIDVPISFGPMEKTYQFRKEQESGQQYYLSLPRIAFTMNGLTFAADRARALEETREWLSEYVNIGDSEDTLFQDFQPTPWNYHFTLYIRTTLMEDFSQIVENILPYFAPKNMLRVKEFSFLNVERDLPVVMDGVNIEFSEDMDETQMREVNGSIQLTVEGWMYKPVSAAKIVKVIKTKYFIGNSFNIGYDTSGFNAMSAIPSSGWDTSGYNSDTDVYWTKGITSAGDIL